MSERMLFPAWMEAAVIREGLRQSMMSVPTLLEWWMGWRR